MKPTVYVETTIVGYLAAEPSSDPVTFGKQVSTQRWWATASDVYTLVTSAVVALEAGSGSAGPAASRLALLHPLPRLAMSEAAHELARDLVAAGALPAKAYRDALHVALSAQNGVDFLLTWNCKHLANARMAGKIEQTCRAAGVIAPRICTPDELE